MYKDRRGVELLDKEAFLKERSEYLEGMHQLQRRAPDQETITITDTDTADWPTVTSTYTDATSTIPTVGE